MFRGASELSVDKAGWIAVPRTYLEQDALNNRKVVITIDPHDRNSLIIFPMNRWEAIEKKLQSLPFSSSAHHLRRLLIGYAVDVEITRGGRMRIPEELRETTHIYNGAVLLGLGENLGLCSKEHYEREQSAFYSSADNVPNFIADLDVPNILLQAVVVPGAKTEDGILIEAVALPWFEIVEMMVKDPNAMYQLDWRKWEEMIAGAYKREGYEVILTPRSGDKGRDVIATKPGFGSIRFIDQVKAYKPGHVVTSNDVMAMLGVLDAERNVSKGIITTTSTFAPGIHKDPRLLKLMPYRLELKPRDALLAWLTAIHNKKP